MEKHIKLIKKIMFITLSIMLVFFSCKIDKKVELENDKNKIDINKYHFYDFNFKITIYNNPVGVSKEIIYQYDPKNKKDNKLKISYFNYHDENNKKFKEPVERDFYISEGKMDSCFEAITEKITPNFLTNKSNKEIPPPPTSSNEWKYCKVELDLLYRGDKYVCTSSNTDIFYHLLESL